MQGADICGKNKTGNLQLGRTWTSKLMALRAQRRQMIPRPQRRRGFESSISRNQLRVTAQWGDLITSWLALVELDTPLRGGRVVCQLRSVVEELGRLARLPDSTDRALYSTWRRLIRSRRF